jgi:hypothetical protein
MEYECICGSRNVTVTSEREDTHEEETNYHVSGYRMEYYCHACGLSGDAEGDLRVIHETAEDVDEMHVIVQPI